MNVHDDKFNEVADIFMKELTNFIKQLLSIHQKVSKNGPISLQDETPKNKLLFLQQQLIKGKLDKVLLDFGVKRAAREISQSEMLALAKVFNSGPFSKDKKDVEYDAIFSNIAVQYLIHNAIMQNEHDIYNGGFTHYMDDALSESYFMVKGFFSFYHTNKAKMADIELEDNVEWKFIMFTKKMLLSKIKHWYLTEIQSYSYIPPKYRLAKQKKKYKRRFIPVEDETLMRMPANDIHHRTIVDKYGETIGDKSYCQLIKEVKEERNPQYALYMDGSYRERKTYKMIAHEYEVSEGAVKAGVSRGLAYLRKKYNKTTTN
ncbi:hypothetical protein SAMN05421676_103106 [Salinibacillus kushneri]|uniref:Uncharacterized protein n=1 Tax=Salinibacillus kushneri TaxID=237682 RepID=A0A1I0CD28_9BACI|nr:hypothetical protein [Salinibacillus kushneri]SET16821.1 hypothetical protein SAMN05421676_103106 [Salinibacillus kushneri]